MHERGKREWLALALLTLKDLYCLARALGTYPQDLDVFFLFFEVLVDATVQLQYRQYFEAIAIRPGLAFYVLYAGKCGNISRPKRFLLCKEADRGMSRYVFGHF